MFTNEQIRTAMTGLVAAKGENHTSYGQYADQITGKGACFLGALCEYMGRAVPREGTAARLVLGEGAVSKEMAEAFVVAQCLNDSHFEWRYVLIGVDLTLRHSTTLPKCPCGCDVGNYTAIINEVGRLRSLDKMREPDYYGMATGGVVKASKFDAVTATATCSSMTTTFTEFSTAIGNLVTAMNTVNWTPSQIVVKKDLALIA